MRAVDARSTSIRRTSLERSKRMVSCGNQASVALAATSILTSTAGIGAERAIDLFRSGRGDDDLRLFADRNADFKIVATSHPAGRVNQHGFERRRSVSGKTYAQGSAFVHPRAAGYAGTAVDRKVDAPACTIGCKGVAAFLCDGRRKGPLLRFSFAIDPLEGNQIAMARLSAASSIRGCRNRRSRRDP